MRKRLVSALLALAIAAIPSLALASHVTEGWPEHQWRTRASDGYTYKIPICFDDTGTDAWPVDGNGQPYGKAAIQWALDKWNSIGGELFFYVGSATCYQLYNHTYGLIPWVEFEFRDIGGTGNIANGQRDLDANNDGQDDCSLASGKCEEAIRISLNPTLYAQYAYYTGFGSPGQYQYDLRTVILHELGHSFIVGECSEESPFCTFDHVMFGQIPAGFTRLNFQAHDIEDYTHFYGNTH